MDECKPLVIGHPIDIKSITACLRKGSTAWGGFKSCREFANAVELMARQRSFTPSSPQVDPRMIPE
jgi:hypothetical protein